MSGPGCIDPVICHKITWHELAWPLLFWPVITELGLFILLFPLQLLFGGKASKWQLKWIGTADLPPTFKLLINLGYILQMLASGVHTAIWIQRTYVHEVTETSKWIEVGLCVFFALHYILNGIKAQWDRGYVLSPASFVDVLTIFPVFYFLTYDPVDIPWLTLSYLRVYRCDLAYDRVEKTGALKDVSDVTRGAVMMTLKGVSLVVILGGTVMILEIFGDPSFLEGTEFTATTFGDISFVQMFYWIFTTISTVGYGDFSPKTVLSQLFSPVCIIVGVTFFTQETGEMLDLMKLESTGKGRFAPRPAGSEHLVVVGGGVANCSSILENFLQRLYQEEGGDYPNCVLMAPGEASVQLREFLAKLPKHARTRVKYFAGSCMSTEDLDRVRLKQAKLGIVICDSQSADPDQEDQGNILRAIAMKRFEKKLDLRLMLLRPESKARAVQVGIRASRCFSVNELKSNLLAISCRCIGWTTMVSHFFTSIPTGERKDEAEEPWFQEYALGQKTQLNGFCIGGEFVGKSFQDFAKECFSAGVAPLAVQVDGKIKLNPRGYALKENDVLFALAEHANMIRPLSNVHQNWAAVFSKAQGQGVPVGNALAKAKDKIDWVSADSDAVVTGTGAASSREGEGPMRSPGRAGGPVVMAAALQHRANSGGALPGQGNQDATRKKALQQQDSARGDKTARGFGKLSEDEMVDLEELSRTIVSTGGHILLVVLSTTTVWQQVQAFTRGVRMNCLPRSTPVIVLSYEHPEKGVYNDICKNFDNVGIVVGAPNKSSDMEKAGMTTASTIVMLAGRPSIDDFRMVDGNGIITLQIIESQTKANVVLELLNEESAMLLTRLPRAPVDEGHVAEATKAVGAATAAQDMAKKEAAKTLLAVSDMMFTDEDMLQERQQDEAFAFLPRFAGGSLFCASCLGAFVAVANYVPGVIELTEALVSGEDTNQTSFPWQIKVPQAFVGKTYLELSTSLLKGFPHAGRVELIAVPLGIYREKAKAVSNDAAHVITNPPPSFKLLASDLVFVLGSAEFAGVCFKDSILSGVFELDDPTMHVNLQAADPDENAKDWVPAREPDEKAAIRVDVTHPPAPDSGRWMPYFCVPDQDKPNDSLAESIKAD